MGWGFVTFKHKVTRCLASIRNTAQPQKLWLAVVMHGVSQNYRLSVEESIFFQATIVFVMKQLFSSQVEKGTVGLEGEGMGEGSVQIPFCV